MRVRSSHENCSFLSRRNRYLQHMMPAGSFLTKLFVLSRCTFSDNFKIILPKYKDASARVRSKSQLSHPKTTVSPSFPSKNHTFRVLDYKRAILTEMRASTGGLHPARPPQSPLPGSSAEALPAPPLLFLCHRK